MESIQLHLPNDDGNNWLAAIDAARGDTPRVEFIREILRKSRELKAYGLQQTRRGGDRRSKAYRRGQRPDGRQ